MNEDELVKYFEEIFNSSNYMKVWNFMKGYLSVEKSTDLGKWIMKS